MKEDYRIEDLVFQKEGIVVYRASDKDDQSYALTLLTYPETMEGDLTESIFLKAFRDLKALKNPSLRELTEGGFDERGKQIWLTNLWGEGETLEDIMQSRPIGTAELMRLKENGDDLIAALGDRADCLAFEAREIFIERSANGLVKNSFVIDYWQWFHHWVTGSGFGAGKDAGDEMLRLMTSLADQMPRRKKAPPPLKTSPLISKPIIVLPGAPEGRPAPAPVPKPAAETEGSSLIQMPGSEPGPLATEAPAATQPASVAQFSTPAEPNQPAPVAQFATPAEPNQPASGTQFATPAEPAQPAPVAQFATPAEPPQPAQAATPEPPKTRELLVVAPALTPLPQPAQQPAVTPTPVPTPQAVPVVQATPASAPTPTKTRLLVTGNTPSQAAVVSTSPAGAPTATPVAAPLPAPKPAAVMASSSGGSGKLWLVMLSLLTIIGVVFGVTKFQAAQKNDLADTAPEEADLPANHSNLDANGGVLNDASGEAFTPRDREVAKTNPVKIDAREAPAVTDTSQEPVRTELPALPVALPILDATQDRRPHPSQITDLSATDTAALKSKIDSWVRVKGTVVQSDARGAWVFEGSGLRAVLHKGQMRHLDEKMKETITCSILGWLIDGESLELQVPQEYDIRVLDSADAVE